MSTGHAAYHHGAHRWFEGHRTLGGPEAWLIWVLATIFVVWLFAIQTGYAVVSPADKERLLRKYWSIPARQVETSVVLADRRWMQRR